MGLPLSRSAFHGNSTSCSHRPLSLARPVPEYLGLPNLILGLKPNLSIVTRSKAPLPQAPGPKHPILTSASSRTCSFPKASIPAESRLSPNSDLPFPSPRSPLNAPSLASTLSHSAPSRRSPPSCARFQYLTVGPHRIGLKQNQQQQHQQQSQLEVPRRDSCRFHGWMGSAASARTLGSAGSTASSAPQPSSAEGAPPSLVP